MLDKVDTVALASIAKTPTVSSTDQVTKEVVEKEVAVVGMAAVAEVMTSEVVTGDEEEVTTAMVVISIEVATGTAIQG